MRVNINPFVPWYLYAIYYIILVAKIERERDVKTTRNSVDKKNKKLSNFDIFEREKTKLLRLYRVDTRVLFSPLENRNIRKGFMD